MRVKRYQAKDVPSGTSQSPVFSILTKSKTKPKTSSFSALAGPLFVAFVTSFVTSTAFADGNLKFGPLEFSNADVRSETSTQRTVDFDVSACLQFDQGTLSQEGISISKIEDKNIELKEFNITDDGNCFLFSDSLTSESYDRYGQIVNYRIKDENRDSFDQVVLSGLVRPHDINKWTFGRDIRELAKEYLISASTDNSDKARILLNEGKVVGAEENDKYNFEFDSYILFPKEQGQKRRTIDTLRPGTYQIDYSITSDKAVMGTVQEGTQMVEVTADNPLTLSGIEIPIDDYTLAEFTISVEVSAFDEASQVARPDILKSETFKGDLLVIEPLESSSFHLREFGPLPDDHLIDNE